MKVVIAADILGDSFNQTKKLFFPIRKKYWLRMGIASFFGGRYNPQSSSFRFPGSSYQVNDTDMNFSEAITTFNNEALKIFSQYGILFSIGFVFLTAWSLFMTYINSVFQFVFLEGVVKKDVRLINSFKKNHYNGVSLFMLRLLASIIVLVCMVIILFPIITAFFANSLINFNLLLLIPMGIAFAILSIIGIIYRLIVFEFLVPIMYLHHMSVKPAFHYFQNIRKGYLMEVFLFWLFRLGLGIAGGIISFFIIIPYLLIAAVFVAIGVGLYFLFSSFAGFWAALFITIVYGLPMGIILLLGLSVVLVPISGFFRVYAVNMVKSLEKKHKLKRKR